MSNVSSLADRLLHLGNRITRALNEEAWHQLAELTERRAQIAQKLVARQQHIEQKRAGKGGGHASQFRALAEQNEQLITLLSERRDHVEDELAQLDQVKTAHRSYEAKPPGKRVLRAGLSG